MQTSPGGSRAHWPSILQLTLSGLAALLFLGGAALALILALLGLIDPTGPAADRASLLGLGLMLGLFGALMLPAAGLALLRLLGHPVPAWLSRRPGLLPVTLAFALAWPAALYLGSWAAEQPRLAPTLLPFFTIAAVALPVAWVLALGARGLSAGSPQRAWGIFDFGLVVTPLVTILLEGVVFVLLALAAGIYAASIPGMAAEITALGQRLANSSMDPEAIQRILLPLLREPGVLYAIAALIAGLIPLIEELLKPLPVWLLAGRRPTPAQGFVTGLASGAGFALLESLSSMLRAPADGWALLAIGRAGTSLLHITTAGILGWALAATWRDGRYLRAVLGYLLAVGLHSAWNLASLSLGVTPLFDFPTRSLPGALDFGGWPSQALPILAVALLAILLGINRSLRRVRPAGALAPTLDSGDQISPDNR